MIVNEDYEGFYEKLFKEDCREKAKAGRGSMHNSGRRGGGTKGAHVKFNYDRMSAKDKKIYMKSGEIMESNVYDQLKNIPSFEEMQTMEYSKANLISKKVRENFTNKEMITYWNINNGKLYDKIYYKFGVLEKPHCRDKNKKTFEGKNFHIYDAHEDIRDVKVIDDLMNQESQEITVDRIDNDLLLPVPDPKDAEIEKMHTLIEAMQKRNELLESQIRESKGLKLNFDGEYTGADILERMLKYVDNLIADKTYNIDLSIIEKL